MKWTVIYFDKDLHDLVGIPLETDIAAKLYQEKLAEKGTYSCLISETVL